MIVVCLYYTKERQGIRQCLKEGHTLKFIINYLKIFNYEQKDQFKRI